MEEIDVAEIGVELVVMDTTDTMDFTVMTTFMVTIDIPTMVTMISVDTTTDLIMDFGIKV